MNKEVFSKYEISDKIDNKNSIRGWVEIFDSNDNNLIDKSNCVLYKGRQLLSDIQFDPDFENYKICGISFGVGGEYTNQMNEIQLNIVDKNELNLYSPIQFVNKNDISSDVLDDYILEGENTYIKKLTKNMISNANDPNNEYKSLIKKVIIPIEAYELNRFQYQDFDIHVNEQILWAMKNNDPETKIPFQKVTFRSIFKDIDTSFKLIWYIFF